MTHLFLIISVLIGACLVVVFKPKQQIIRLFLAFSGAYLLAITVSHLLPEIYRSNLASSENNTNIGLFILIGIIVQSILESFSKGAEHGHIHLDKNSNKFSWTLFISLSIHAFSEGIPVGYADNNSLLWAICIHKIPIGVVLMTFLLHDKQSKKQGYLFILLFSLMSPIGAILSEKIPLFIIYHQEITAITIGIFLHISTIILFESSKNHKFNYSKFISIVLGMALAFL